MQTTEMRLRFQLPALRVFTGKMCVWFENLHIHARRHQMLSSLVIMEAAVWKTDSGYNIFGICAANFIVARPTQPMDNLTGDHRKSE